MDTAVDTTSTIYMYGVFFREITARAVTALRSTVISPRLCFMPHCYFRLIEIRDSIMLYGLLLDFIAAYTRTDVRTV